MNNRQILPLTLQFSREDREQILKNIDSCLEQGQLAPGRFVADFEAQFAKHANSKFAVAVSSGGSALEVAMRALGVQDSEVIVPTNTFFATAAGVLAAGGRLKLVDINPLTAAPDLANIAAAINPLTKGVILVHIGGVVNPDTPAIRDLCDKYGIWLFEDCAHAHGSKLNQIAAGNFGVGGAYSFCSTKVVTSGEGGMVVTNDEELANSMRLLRNYGKPDAWVTYSVQFGMNWRLNEIAAIIGINQLHRLDESRQRRLTIANSYSKRLGTLSEFQAVLPQGESSWYKYIVLLPTRIDRRLFRDRLRDFGIALPGGVYDIPLHRQPVLSNVESSKSFIGAESFCSRHVCLPIHLGLSDDDVNYVIDHVSKVWET